eukprot:5215621-Amphidinium_carterae.1
MHKSVRDSQVAPRRVRLLLCSATCSGSNACIEQVVSLAPLRCGKRDIQRTRHRPTKAFRMILTEGKTKAVLFGVDFPILGG